MQKLELTTALADRADYTLSGLTFMEFMPEGDDLWLLAGSAATNTISRFRLSEGAGLQASDVYWLSFANSFSADDGVCITLGSETRLFSNDTLDGTVVLHPLTSSAVPSSPLQLLDQGGAPVLLSGLVCLESETQTYLAGTGPDGAGLVLYSLLDNWRVSLETQITDTPKSAASGISDLLEIASGSARYVISASQEESGLTSYALGDGGTLEFVDSISTHDGLWISGLSEIVHVQAEGQDFVIGVSPNSSTLSVVRVNPMGVFFITDLVTDTLNTRFQGAATLEHFSVDGRDFILTGGADAGLSMFELLPGGKLYHHQSLAQGADWNLGAIETIRATVFDSEIQIFVSGSNTGGLAQLSLVRDAFGNRTLGTNTADMIESGPLDDLVMGFGGNDLLEGGAGDDTLIAGTGSDTLIGGTGSDVFVFEADAEADVVRTFEKGVDRLDLSDWGMIYDYNSLSIAYHRDGATISWQDELLHIRTIDGQGIISTNWEADDFLF